MTIRWNPVRATIAITATLIVVLPIAHAQDRGTTQPGAGSVPQELPAPRTSPALATRPSRPWQAGTWRVQMGVYGTLGRWADEPPITPDDLGARREWVAGSRYLEATTEGTLEGARY